jgi:uncharacterized protein (TIGR03067 family)
MRLNVIYAALLGLLFPIGAWSADEKVDAKADTKTAAKADDTTGTWTAESAEMAGMSLPAEFCKAIKLVIKGDKYKLTINNTVEEGTSKSDATATPKTLDVMGSSGPNKGKTLQAIYELNGDTLKVCYDLSGSGRPKEFKTMPGTQQFMVTYKKSKG